MGGSPLWNLWGIKRIRSNPPLANQKQKQDKSRLLIIRPRVGLSCISKQEGNPDFRYIYFSSRAICCALTLLGENG